MEIDNQTILGVNNKRATLNNAKKFIIKDYTT